MISHEECLAKLAELRRLKDLKAEHEQGKKNAQKAIDELQADLVEYYQMNDMQNIKTGEGVFYIKNTSIPTIENQEVVLQWLAERGDLDHLMSFNSNKFRAYCKERKEQEEELPPTVTEFIKTTVETRRA